MWISKIIWTLGIVSSWLVWQAQINTIQDQTDVLTSDTSKTIQNTKWWLHTNMVWYLDFAAHYNPNHITRYQYAVDGLNHAVGGIKGTFGNKGQWSFNLLWQTGQYPTANYLWTDANAITHLHDANISRQFDSKNGNYIKIEWWVFGWSPIGQPGIIPISLPDGVSWTDVPRDIIGNIMQQVWTQLSENTPYYITGAFVTRHQGKRDLKVGVTNGAQHIIDNNNKLWAFWSVQYTPSDKAQFYACYHISDEGTTTENIQHIAEAHAVLKPGKLTLVPAVYLNTNKDNTLYGGSAQVTYPLNNSTKIGAMGEYNHNPQWLTFSNKGYRETAIELQKVLQAWPNSNVLLSGYLGVENAGQGIKPNFWVSLKTWLNFNNLFKKKQ
jgi:hypothetical protein